jgi:tetratricopeptide (TPR) repeat protein
MKRITSTFFLFLAFLIPAGAALGQALKQSVRVAYPGKSWAVEIDSPGLVVETEERKPDGREYLFAKDPATGLLISVTLEQTKGGADPKSCPDFLQKRLDSLTQMEPQDVKTSEIQQMAALEYLLPRVSGVPLRQKNMFACTAKEDVFIDIHLSKVQFHDSDESLFADLLSRVRIDEKTNVVESTARRAPAAPAAAGQSSTQLFSEGSRFFIRQDFQGAIAPYQAALDLEKKQRKLSQNYWRVLVDNLGMAYGISGDLDRAEETFDYGVSQDPGYPMFYYNLGCTYAERNDMNRAMEYLQKAFSLKANSIPGEGMPDPRRDDSFQRFLGNEQFRKFLDTLN